MFWVNYFKLQSYDNYNAFVDEEIKRCKLVFWFETVWCRRTDELVDGPNSSHITPKALDRWESRLEDLFNGRPFDMLDAALSDTVSKFPVDIQVKIYKSITFDKMYFLISIINKLTLNKEF